LFSTGAWFAIFGSAVASALLAGASKYSRGGFALGASLRSGILTGVLCGFLSGAVAEWIFQLGPNSLLQIICWGVAGGLLGFGLSHAVPNLGRLRGLVAGAAGGWLGGAAFLAIGAGLGQGPGRIAGLAIIGSAIGGALIAAEAAFGKAWLEIAYGPKERKMLALGREPVTVGGVPNSATVWLRQGPSPAHRYWLEEGRIWLDEGRGKVAVDAGHRQEFGSASVTVLCAGPAATVPIPAALPTSGLVLWMEGRMLPLGEGAQIRRADLTGKAAIDRPHEVVGRVERHPRRPETLGLRNVSGQLWCVRSPTGQERLVEPGQTLGVAPGVMIQFGSIEGEIR
jgi:hypothetical protein